MASQYQDEVKVECPHCHFKLKIRIPSDNSERMSTVVLGDDNFLTGIFKRLGDLGKNKDEELEKANAWEVKKCPNCHRTFQYNTKAGEVQK
jgi:protein-arginine kinase activator protein McsA